MEGNGTISKVIPDGERSCIWVEAGLVSYKLCDRNFECDDCPFDSVMRQKGTPASASSSSGDRKIPGESGGIIGTRKQDTLLAVIGGIFDEPFSVKPPADRFYSRGHVWVKAVGDDTYRLGIDHYAASLLEGIGGIVFPQAGTSSVRNNPCAWLLCDGGTIAVHSPLNGKIRKVNQALMESASLVRKDPYDSGWLSEISSSEEVSKSCLPADAMESSSRSEFQCLGRQIVEEFGRKPSTLGETLLDGGTHSHSLKDILGAAKYVSFLQKLHSCRI